MQETRQEILEVLGEGRASGPALADRLGVSRAAVWKHVEALREAGFTIESHDGGYELAGAPEFGGPAVEWGLEAPFGVEYHDAIDSTNRRARELARAGRENVVVLADRQTGGRGRLDREWVSPSGGVWLSVILRPDVAPAWAPAFTLAAAVATARAIREHGLEATIKWPNDVLLETEDGERKLAGVLTEMEGEADRISWLVVGIGVNANVHSGDLPPGSTSARAEHGDLDRRSFTQRLLELFEHHRNDLEGALAAWRELSGTLGRRVRVDTQDGEVVGEAVDVVFPGTLVIETETGRREVTAGDCEHLRPAE